MAQKAVAVPAVNPRGTTVESNEAVRTCIGCRKVEVRSQLIRLVKSTNSSGETEALVDVRRRLPGRGAWLHPREECWKVAIKRRAIGRALPGVTTVHGIETFAHNELPHLAAHVLRT